jgi:hypothetical protein
MTQLRIGVSGWDAGAGEGFDFIHAAGVRRCCAQRA